MAQLLKLDKGRANGGIGVIGGEHVQPVKRYTTVKLRSLEEYKFFLKHLFYKKFLSIAQKN